MEASMSPDNVHDDLDNDSDVFISVSASPPQDKSETCVVVCSENECRIGPEDTCSSSHFCGVGVADRGSRPLLVAGDEGLSSSASSRRDYLGSPDELVGDVSDGNSTGSPMQLHDEENAHRYEYAAGKTSRSNEDTHACQNARLSDVLLVNCKSVTAELVKSRLGSGSRGKCIRSEGQWYTPSEFEMHAGRGLSKDWKRSIRYQGRPLIRLIEANVLVPHAISCTCPVCVSDATVASTAGPVRVHVPRQRKRQKLDSAGVDYVSSGLTSRYSLSGTSSGPGEYRARAKSYNGVTSPCSDLSGGSMLTPIASTFSYSSGASQKTSNENNKFSPEPSDPITMVRGADGGSSCGTPNSCSSSNTYLPHQYRQESAAAVPTRPRTESLVSMAYRSDAYEASERGGIHAQFPLSSLDSTPPDHSGRSHQHAVPPPLSLVLQQSQHSQPSLSEGGPNELVHQRNPPSTPSAHMILPVGGSTVLMPELVPMPSYAASSGRGTELLDSGIPGPRPSLSAMGPQPGSLRSGSRESGSSCSNATSAMWNTMLEAIHSISQAVERLRTAVDHVRVMTEQTLEASSRAELAASEALKQQQAEIFSLVCRGLLDNAVDPQGVLRTLLQKIQPNSVVSNPADPAGSKTCLNCGREAVFSCAGCYVAAYCSPHCQKKDWITHRPACTVTSARSTTLGGSPAVTPTASGHAPNVYAFDSQAHRLGMPEYQRKPSTPTAITTSSPAIAYQHHMPQPHAQQQQQAASMHPNASASATRVSAAPSLRTSNSLVKTTLWAPPPT